MESTTCDGVTVYINGKPHRTTLRKGMHGFYADHPSLPGRLCSCHRVGAEAVRALFNGLGVLTLGNSYSLRPQKEPECTT